MMDELDSYCGEPYSITPKIAVRNPTLGEIRKYGEQKYFGLVHSLCATPADRKVEIWDSMHVYWDSIKEYDLFLSVFQALHNEDMSILFGDLDTSSFKIMIGRDMKSIQLCNQDGAVIDRAIYKLLTDYLRSIHMLKKNVVTPYDDYTRDVIIEAERYDMEEAEGKPTHSILQPLISSMTNLPGSQYRWDTVWDVPVGVFMDSVVRVQKRDSYVFTMIGIYSGNVDTKKINKKELDWMNYFGKEK